jgi:hypothetical protein
MQEEFQALKKNDTWELVTLLAGKRVVGCKWVYTVNQTPESKVERWKGTRRDWWQKDIVRLMVLTMMRLLLQ